MASGLAVGLSMGLGGIAAVALGAVADAVDLETALVCSAFAPLLGVVLCFFLPAPSRPRLLRQLRPRPTLCSTDARFARPTPCSPEPDKEIQMTVQEFFDALPSKVDPAKTAGMNNSFAFDIADVGVWTVTVADGAVSVAEGENDADCTISASEETLMKIASGEANPTTAYMTGKLKIKGDMGAALKLQKLF